MDLKILISLGISICISIGSFAQIEEVTNLNGSSDGVPRFNNGATILFNDLLYFRGEGGVSEELFMTNGTEGGEQVIRTKDGRRVDRPTSFIVLDSIFVFKAFDREIGEGLYRSNGSTSGTFRILDKSISVIQCMTKKGNKVFFKGESNDELSELWVSDGTEEGTLNLTDSSGNFINFPCGFHELNDKMYFSADIPGSGSELFVSDGTSQGTYLVKDINPGDAQAFNGTAAVFKNKLFFNATSPGIGNELWVTDGTSEETNLIKDIHVGPPNAFPSPILVEEDVMYFTANDAEHGIELWTTDGTPEGTQLFYDVRTGSVGSSPTYFNRFKDGFIIYANRMGLGFELNFINAAGEIDTIRDINRGPASASAFTFYQVNDLLYFNATDAIHGKELWISDGTFEGTNMVVDLLEGAEGSDPELLILKEDGFYFSATTVSKGREIYFYRFETTSLEPTESRLPIEVFPNPTFDILFIKSPFEMTSVQLFDMSGSLILEKVIPQRIQHELSLTSIPSGSYVLKVFGNQLHQTQTIIKH